MKKNILLKLAIVSCFFLASTPGSNKNLDDARKRVKSFATELQGLLQNTLSSKGPVAAIEVCSKKASVIAEKHSNDGWRVKRTSLRPRNADNSPDKWEREVLLLFEKWRKEGKEPDKLEYYETVEIDGKKRFRYMKAIVTKPLCTLCHGTNIPQEISNKILNLYPEDKARGFKEGDIRGAFSLIYNLEN